MSRNAGQQPLRVVWSRSNYLNRELLDGQIRNVFDFTQELLDETIQSQFGSEEFPCEIFL